jgi:hypothetical protein
MAKSKYIAKENVEEYFTNSYNVQYYQEWKENEKWNQLFDSLELFNLIHERVHFTYMNLKNPLLVAKNTKELDLTEKQCHCLLYFLQKKLYDEFVIDPTLPRFNNTPRYVSGRTKAAIERYKNVIEFLKTDFEALDKKLYPTEEEVQKQTTIDTSSNLKLSSKRGTKIELIRILNAMYELRMFETPDGQIPSKVEFMKEMGTFLNTDLSNYHINLSQSLKNQPLEANLDIFEKLKKVTQDTFYERE